MNPERYKRQTALKEFGPEGQEALKNAAVLIVGAGGLGVSIAQYLNAMGIGRLGIIDGDTIELSNLHRQPTYTPDNVGLAKTKVLGNWLLAQNPETELTLYDCFLTAHNALDILRSYRLIIDATDNLNTRYLIDDACLILGLPWIYGALYGFEGQISVFNYKNGPTYRCLFPNKPNLGEIPDCNTLGTLGVLPGIIGNLQALEAVKLLSGLPGILSGTILMYDAIRQEFRHFKLRRNPNRKSNLNILDGLEYTLNTSLEGISLNDYFSFETTSNNQILVDVREPEEFEEFSIPNSRNIPLHNLQSKLAYLSAFDQIFLVCKSGPRSMRAYELIKRELPNSYVKWISGGVEEFKTMEL